MNPTLETATVGIQKKTILNALLSSRLAVKNIANNAMANIQNRGENILSMSAANTATPVAFDPLIPFSGDQGPGRSSAMISAASTLRMLLM